MIRYNQTIRLNGYPKRYLLDFNIHSNNSLDPYHDVYGVEGTIEFMNNDIRYKCIKIHPKKHWVLDTTFILINGSLIPTVLRYGTLDHNKNIPYKFDVLLNINSVSKILNNSLKSPNTFIVGDRNNLISNKLYIPFIHKLFNDLDESTCSVNHYRTEMNQILNDNSPLFINIINRSYGGNFIYEHILNELADSLISHNNDSSFVSILQRDLPGSETFCEYKVSSISGANIPLNALSTQFRYQDPLFNYEYIDLNTNSDSISLKVHNNVLHEFINELVIHGYVCMYSQFTISVDLHKHDLDMINVVGALVNYESTIFPERILSEFRDDSQLDSLRYDYTKIITNFKRLAGITEGNIVIQKSVDDILTITITGINLHKHFVIDMALYLPWTFIQKELSI